MEQWKQIKETDYSISNKGRVRNNLTTLILKDQNSWNGYRSIEIRVDKKRVKHQVHRLVAEYFLSNFDSSLQVNHKNFDKAENSVFNLEMVTFEENIQHAIQNGRMVVFKGEEHGCAKLNWEQVKEIRNSGKKAKELSQQYGISIRQMYRILNNTKWIE